MSKRKTSKATPNGISSPELAAGPTPCVWLDGPIQDPALQGPAHVSRFRSQDSDKAMPTDDTCGPLFTASSQSASFQSSLESRLRARMGENGSRLFALTWRPMDMPAGVSLCQLAVSVRRISGIGCSSWPTPVSDPANGTPEAFLERKRRAVEKGSQMGICLSDIAMVAQLTTWPTPTEDDSNNGTRESGQFQSLTRTASWVTPNSRDWKDTPGQRVTSVNPDGSPRVRLDQLPRQATLAGWVSPTACSPNSLRGRGQDPMKRKEGNHAVNLQDQVTLTSGPTASGSPAATENPGQLNPALARWLQGYPAAWDVAAIRAHRLMRTRRQRGV